MNNQLIKYYYLQQCDDDPSSDDEDDMNVDDDVYGITTVVNLSEKKVCTHFAPFFLCLFCLRIMKHSFFSPEHGVCESVALIIERT